MALFLTLQNTYSHLEAGLFNDSTSVENKQVDKIYASRDCALLIDQLLKKHTLTYADLSFCAVNQGPGPFTTLRTIIASANGLSFSTNLPLVGVDGLQAALDEYATDHTRTTVFLLNAFNHDVYYGIQSGNTQTTGYCHIQTLIEHIRATNKAVYFIGNGTKKYASLIQEQLGALAIIPDPLPDYVSLQQIASNGLQQWHTQTNVHHSLLPLYLKEYSL